MVTVRRGSSGDLVKLEERVGGIDKAGEGRNAYRLDTRELGGQEIRELRREWLEGDVGADGTSIYRWQRRIKTQK